MSWFSTWKRKSSQIDAGDATDTSHIRASVAPPQPVEKILQGRRSRQEVPYALPRDPSEINRQDLQHYLIKQALKTNFVAPLSARRTTSILDVGCGTGRWVLEMGAAFPMAHVTGLDMEMPCVASEPHETNCSFIKGNVLQRLPFPDNTFTYVHQRFLASAILIDMWPQVLAELVRVTAPGGWIELVEILHRVEPMWAAGRHISGWVEQFYEMQGIYPGIGEGLVILVDNASLLTEKNVYYHDLPVGAWGGQAGALLAQNHLSAYAEVKPAYVEQLQIDPVAFDFMLDTVPKEWENAQAHSRCYLAIAQKTTPARS